MLFDDETNAGCLMYWIVWYCVNLTVASAFMDFCIKTKLIVSSSCRCH